jgi:hypothetical protein
MDFLRLGKLEELGSLFAVWRFFGVLLGTVEHPLEPQRKISCTGCSGGVMHGICRAFLSPQVKWYASKILPAAFNHFRAGADTSYPTPSFGLLKHRRDLPG